jgi:hypothetical protein
MDVNTSTALTFEDINLYPYPNPALANILLGAQMQAIVAKGIAKVLASFLVKQAQSQTPYKDPGRQRRAGGHPPGQLMHETSAEVMVGAAAPGLPSDRWIGQITIGVVYAQASTYGRDAYAQYAGTYNLQQAMYSVFPSQT